jgi:tetrahydromethanopterin S-methyltransferase subunit E
VPATTNNKEMSVLAVAVLIALCVSGAFAVTSSVGGVVNVLKDATFAEEVASGYWLVEFYAPW